MTTLRVLIADDEPDARDKLRRLLSRRDDAIVVAEAANGREAIERVRVERPDLVLLDIRMPDVDGVHAAELLAPVQTAATPPSSLAAPKIVFVTAYDDYAVRAFELRAFDYLLKPFDAARLDAVLDRVRAQLELEHRPDHTALAAVIERLQQPTPTSGEAGAENRFVDHIRIPGTSGVQIVRLDDIEWIEPPGNYTRFHTTGGRPMLRETLRGLLGRLDPRRFVRIHRSAIVAVDRIRALRPSASGDYVVELHSGTRLRLSRTYRAEVDRRLGRHI